jgi:enoyl-CoA hydratase
MGDLVDYKLADGVATITMDDGKVNALSFAMLAQVSEALDQAESDGAVVILSGRPGRFSAGFDLATLTGGGSDGPELLGAGFWLSEKMLSFPFPIVIACTGHALAMGSFLLLSGDYRIGADGAFKIGANEVAIGMVMPQTAIEICRQRIPTSHFGRVINNAEIFTPEGAVAAGYLDQVVPEGELAAAALEKATQLTALNLKAHGATKLLSRAEPLAAIRAAIGDDVGAFKLMSGG